MIVDDPIYRANLLKRARKGKLAPPVECLLWYYSKGKPAETHRHDLTVHGLAEAMHRARKRAANAGNDPQEESSDV